MWVAAVGSRVDGSDCTHRTAKPNKPAPKAADKPVATKLMCDLTGPDGAKWCTRCRWYDRRSECPGSIVPMVLDLNAKLEKKHALAELAPVRSSELVKDMAVLVCLVCGASAAAKPSTFKKECGRPGSKGKAVLSRLEKRLAPTISERVVVSIKMLDGSSASSGPSS